LRDQIRPATELFSRVQFAQGAVIGRMPTQRWRESDLLDRGHFASIVGDNIGAYNHLVMDMGEQTALWPDDLVFEALLAGETELAFDGNPFFSNSHALKSGSAIDNLHTSTALTKDNVAAIIELMMGYVGEDGRSLRRPCNPT
jgi:phage major head subunit gpT-like protein